MKMIQNPISVHFKIGCKQPLDFVCRRIKNVYYKQNIKYNAL